MACKFKLIPNKFKPIASSFCADVIEVATGKRLAGLSDSPYRKANYTVRFYCPPFPNVKAPGFNQTHDFESKNEGFAFYVCILAISKWLIA